MEKKLKLLSKTFVIMAVMCLAFSQSGCSNHIKNIDLAKILNYNGEYKKGVKAYNEKEYDVAIVSLSNALNHNPDSYSTYCYLGTAYLYKGDDGNAEKILREAIKKYPEQWNAYTFLGELKRKQHDYASAIECYENAVKLESMPEESKPYYKKLINDIKKEKFNWEGKGNIPIREKINPKNATPSYNVTINTDPKIWEKMYEVANDKNGITEYGKKGEDVKNYKWTELVTVQYFVLNEAFQYSAQEYLAAHIAPIEAMAKDSHKSFVRKTLSETKGDILYEWSFDQGKESEISRIVQTPNALYHLHYAKKGALTPEEKTKWIEILKAAKVGD